MLVAEIQRRAVDGIKRHAIRLSIDSPRAEAHILTEYLWTEEGAETAALHRSRTQDAPEWIDRLASNQLADEARHAELLRQRLGELGARIDRTPPSLVRAKLWWLERATAEYLDGFDAGPIVVVLAIAAQLEATGVRMFGRHLGVLERYRPGDDPTAEMLRAIVADEKRHARSCAIAAERLVKDHERERFEKLRRRVAEIDRAFGVTISMGFWLAIAANAARDHVRSRGGRR
jgi:hypothetical protein